MSRKPRHEDLVACSVAADGIAVVEMRDAAGRNALDERFVEALLTALDRAVADSAARVIVLTGGRDVFSSGAPKALLKRLLDGDVAPTDIELPRHLLAVPLPMIAAMEGHATGGGFALGLCADIVIIARESRYGLSFMNMGLTPGMGATRLLEHCLTPAVAAELMFTGEFRKGADFAGTGGFNYVLPKAEVRPKAMDVAARIAEKPRTALETLKRGLAERRRQAFEQAYALETEMHRVALAQPEIRRLIEEEYVE